MAWTSAARPLVSVLSLLLLAACGGGGGNGGSGNPPPGGQNQPPTAAIAGPATGAALAGEEITLDAGVSSDSDGSIASVLWTQLDGPAVEIADPSAAVLVFMAPAVTEDTEIVFRLIVTDDDGTTASEEIRLLIHAAVAGNVSPRAAASGDLVVRAGDEVHLDARSSMDADGRIASFEWVQIDGPGVLLTAAKSAVAAFTAPDAGAELQFRVIVTDDAGATASDTVAVRVLAGSANEPPQAAITPLANPVPEGTGFMLNGGASADPENADLEFHWTVPAGFTVDGGTGKARLQLSGTPDVTADTAYTFLLVVSDGQFTASAATEVTVKAFNNPPVVSIGSTPAGIAATGVDEGVDVTLTATASDPDKHAVERFTWEQLDGEPVPGLADITGPDLAFTAAGVGPEGGRYEFRVTAEDSEGATASATLAFDVNFVNQAPVVVLNSSATGAPEGTVLDLASTSSDDDGQPLAFQWEQIDLQNGMPDVSIIDNGDGTASVVLPDIGPQQDGFPIRVRVTVDDGHGAANSKAFAETDIAVQFDNRLPQLGEGGISASHGTVDEGELAAPVTLTVDAFDPDGSGLTYDWQIPDGFVTSGDGTPVLTIARTPDIAATTEFTFDVDVSDGFGTSVFQVPFTVNFVNRIPEADAGADLAIPENADLVAQEFRLDGSASSDGDADAGHQQLTHTWQVPEGSGLELDDVNAISPRIIAVPDVDPADTAPIIVTLEVNDGVTTATDTVEVTVGFVNTRPVVDGIDGVETVEEGGSFQLTASAHDDDEGQNLSYEWTVPVGFTVEPGSVNAQTLVVTGTPGVEPADAAEGIEATFRVVAIDDSGIEASERSLSVGHAVTVTYLNNVPEIGSVEGPGNVNEQTQDIALTANGSDDDGQAADLVYTWTRSANDVSGISNDVLGVALPFTGQTLEFDAPDVDVDRTVIFAVTASDGFDDSETVEFSVTIDKDGGLPEIDPFTPLNPSLAEGGGLSFTLTANASDNLTAPEDLEYQWSPAADFTTTVDPLQPHILTIQATPDVGPGGEDFSFTVTVTDSDGNSAQRTVNVHVDFVNQQPVVDGIGDVDTIEEGSSFQLTASAHDDDVGQNLSYEWTVPAGFTVEPGSVNAQILTVTGTPDVEPADAAEGVAGIFSVVAIDDSGNEASERSLSVSHTVTVTYLNNVPEIGSVNGPGNVNEQTTNHTLTANGSDDDGQAADLVYTWTRSANDVSGIADDALNVTLPFTGQALTFNAPAVDTEKTVIFEVTANDGFDESPPFVVPVIIDTDGVAPVIASITPLNPNLDEGDGLSFTLTANATDNLDDSIELDYQWSPASGFTTTVDPGQPHILTIQSTPNVDSDGEDFAFAVMVTDSDGNSDQQTVNVHVGFVNQPPQITAAGSNGPVNEDEQGRLTVIANDDDGQPLGYVWLQREGEIPSVGTITVDSATGTGTFTAPGVPGGAESMDLHFTVTVDDGNGGVTSSEEVTVTVNRVNDPPSNVQIPASGQTAVQEGSINLTLTATAIDDGPPENLIYTWSGHESFTASANGSVLNLTATPDVTTTQTFPITVTVQDSDGASASGTIDVTVQFVNQPPQNPAITSNPQDLVASGVDEGSQITLIANANDLDGDTISYTWQQTAGTTDLGISGNVGSQLIFTPDLENGDENFTIQVTANDGTDTAVASIEFAVHDLGGAPAVAINPQPANLVTDGIMSGFEATLTAEASNLQSPVSYAWSQTAGDPVPGIDGSTGEVLSFTAPEVTSENFITVQVAVTGNGGTAISTDIDFTIKPRPDDMPLPFSFDDLEPAPASASPFVGVTFESNPITVQGLGDDDSAPIGITGDGTYSIDGAPFTSASGTISNGQSVVVRLQGPKQTESAVSTALTVGEFSDAFTVNGVTSGLTTEGIAGGLRVSWDEMQGVSEYVVSFGPFASTGAEIATSPGDTEQIDHFFPLWSTFWQNNPALSNRFEYTLQATGVSDVLEVELLGSPLPLEQEMSVDAITYVKSDAPEADGAFGSAIAVNLGGDIMVVGAPAESFGTGNHEGRVHVYRRAAESWVSGGTPLHGPNAGDGFGSAVALSGDGTVLAIGAPAADPGGNTSAGEVHIYRLSESSGLFISDTTLRLGSAVSAGDQFGTALALNEDGTVLAVGVPLDDRSGIADDETASDSGTVFVFRHDGIAWNEEAVLKETTVTDGNHFGTAVALSGAGTRLFASRTGTSRAVLVFNHSGGTWSLSNTVSNTAPGFGDNLSAARVPGHANDGKRFVSGIAAYRTSDGINWLEMDAPSSPGLQGTPAFSTIDPYGNTIAIGVIGDETIAGAGVYNVMPSGPADSAGAIYTFALANPWFFHSFLKAPNPDDGDAFGQCAVFDGRTNASGFVSLARLYACAPGEDSDGTGVHPVEPVDKRSNDDVSNAGAIYIY